MLKIDQLVSGYGSVQILNGANMKVEKQSIVALLGGNGTGKSTILRAASGLIRSWKGTIEFNGEQIQNLPAHAHWDRCFHINFSLHHGGTLWAYKHKLFLRIPKYLGTPRNSQELL